MMTDAAELLGFARAIGSLVALKERRAALLLLSDANLTADQLLALPEVRQSHELFRQIAPLSRVA